jgi:hypothetical protein
MPIHLHVDGEGYFRFARGTEAVYSADATLSTSKGYLASLDGYPLLPQIHVPTDGAGVKVDLDGTVTVSGKNVGRIVLATFGGASLSKVGSYYLATTRSSIGYPGEGILGVVRFSNGTKSARNTQVQTYQAPAETGITIEVRFHNEIDKSHILLGDIADITGSSNETISDLDLGTTPILGATRGITRSYIVASLKGQGVNTDHIEIVCPVGADVVRKSQNVPEDAMVSAAIDGAKTKLGLDYPMRSAHDVTDLLAPSGDLQIVARDAQPNGDGASVEIEVDVDGKPVGHRNVLLVPTTPLPAVHAGDPLKIMLEKNGATVQVSGKARGTAKLGGSISVETETGATFTGILTTISIVEVKL